MGEAPRRMELGLMPQGLQPGQPQQIQVDLTNATQRLCECGCKYFTPAVQVFTVSALMSPIGQELTAQQPVLICLECKTVLK
jgi:hypothetical protein